MVAQIDDAGRDGRIMLAAALDPSELMAHAAEQVTIRDEIAWNDTTRSVLARRRTMLGALVLGDSAIADPDSNAIASALLDGIARVGLARLPWTRAAMALRERLGFLHHHDTSWPDVSDAALLASLAAWLGPHIAGVRTLDAVQRIDLVQVLRGLARLGASAATRRTGAGANRSAQRLARSRLITEIRAYRCSRFACRRCSA